MITIEYRSGGGDLIALIKPLEREQSPRCYELGARYIDSVPGKAFTRTRTLSEAVDFVEKYMAQ